jgi:hypothetical protein
MLVRGTRHLPHGARKFRIEESHMGTGRGLIASGIALILCGCAALNADRVPLPITAKTDVATSPVVRESLPQLPAPAAPAARSTIPKPEAAATAPVLAHVAPGLLAPPVAPPAAAPPSLPPGTLYVCTALVDGQVRQTAIEFEPKVRQLCSKHPEMGVCQYEREACRASGGRVTTAAGVEITRQTEAEYDKKVLRVRFRAG